MENIKYFELLVSKFPPTENSNFLTQLKENCNIHTLEKNEPLIAFQSNNRKIYFIAQGSFIRSIITSRGEEKTVMFHTESFCEFFKSYDTVYFHKGTNYEIKANEKSVVVSVDFDFFISRYKTTLNF